MKRAVLLLPFLLALSAPALSAMDNGTAIRFQTLTIKDGLAQNSVTAIAQDETGYLWFGSQDGLNRYDGKRFTIFKNDPNDPRSIPANYITVVLAGDDGDVWAGTRFGGLARYDAKRGNFERLAIAYSDGSGGSARDARFVVHDLAMHAGTLWVATDRGLATLDDGARVLRLHAQPGAQPFVETRALSADANELWIGGVGRVLRYVEESFNSVALPEHDLVVNAMTKSAQGVLHVATNRGVFELQERNDVLVFERVHGLPQALFSALANDGEGGLWAGGRGVGAYYSSAHDSATENNWKHFNYRADDPWGIGQSIVFDIHADRNGVVWIGTYGGGLSRTVLRQQRFGLQQRRSDDNGLSSNIVFPIHEDRNGVVWIGMYNDGLNRWDRARDEWAYFRHDPREPGSLSDNEVRSLLSDEEGTLWVGTHGGLDRLDAGETAFVHYRHDPNDPDSVAHDGITALFIDNKKRFWVGTWGGGLDRFHPETGRFEHYRPDSANPRALSNGLVSDIAQTPDGMLWIATERGGLNRFDPDTGTFEHYRHDDHAAGSLSNDSLNSLWPDDEGNLWIGTANGLDRLHIASGEIRHYRERDGLANNLVLGILGDDDGKLWISTNRGLSRLDPQTGEFTSYTEADGLQSDEFNSFAFTKNANGEMYFGGIGGFNVFDPASIASDPVPPRAVITGLALFNTPVVPAPENEDAILRAPIEQTRTITLDYSENLFSIEFAALTFADPARNRFAYRLLGFGDEWLETTAEKPFATFTNLDPGEYQFEVVAANPDGTWSETPATLGVTVLPPWWQTLPAYIAYALFLAAIAWLVLQYQRKRIEVQYLAREKATAEEATRLKSSFLALMSHEIRTPMNGVLGMVQLLARTRLSRRQRGYVEALEKSGESLLTILDDVLDFSRIEADVISFESIAFDPREVIDSVVLLLGARAREKSISLSFRTDELPPAVKGDPTRLRQVLLNLVSNAIKFTPAGGVKIRAAQQAAGENRVRVTFTVEDTGIGISYTQQQQLFDAFTQADTSTRRTYGGTGLGLSICKKLVELQGGHIGVESEAGAGSVFWFELEFEIADAPPRVDVAAIRPGRMLRVLLVEDQPINQEVARGLLEHEGHAVSVAPDGPTGLKLITERQFDVVLMDIHMPGMDGREVTRRIRALDDPVKASIPILGLTASISADDVTSCLDAGMSKVLRKPLPAARLAQALAQLDDDESASVETAEREQQLIDTGLLAQHRQALGDERFHEIVATFRRTSAELVDRIEAAAMTGDANTIRRDAHRLAGTAASMGCAMLAAAAADVEQGLAEPDGLRSLQRRTEHAMRDLERGTTA